MPDDFGQTLEGIFGPGQQEAQRPSPVPPVKTGGEPRSYDAILESVFGPGQNPAQSAKARVYGVGDGKPEDAASAQVSAKALRVPAETTISDPPAFAQRVKLDQTAQLVDDNPVLQRYVNETPNAAQLSKDDFPALDKAAKSIAALNEPHHTETAQTRAAAFDPEAASARPSEAEVAISHPDIWGRGPGFEPGLVQTIPKGLEMLASEEGRAKLLKALVSAPYHFLQGLIDPVVLSHEIATGEASLSDPETMDRAIGFGFNVAMGRLNKLPVTGRTAGEAAKPTLETWQDVAKAVRREQPVQRIGGSDFEVNTKPLTTKETAAALTKQAEELRSLLHSQEVTEMFERAGEKTPYGVDPLVDRATEERVRASLDRLKQAKSDLDATETRELSRDHAAHLAAVATDAEVGIPVERIRELYGDKAPAAGDGLLGDVIPGLAERLNNPADIYVKASDLLAHAEKEIVNELGDDFKLRGDPSIGDTKLEVEPREVDADPVSLLRAAAGMDEPGRLGSTLARPVGEEIRIHGAERDTTVAEHLGALYAGEGVSPLTRQIVDKLRGLVGEVPVKIRHEFTDAEAVANRWNGFFDAATNEVHVKSNAPAFVAVHEAIHAATWQAIEQDAGVKAGIERMMDGVTWVHGRLHPSHPGSYAMTSPHEFVAEAFSNPKFQRWLAKQEVTPELRARLGIEGRPKTLWHAFVEWIRDALGLPKGAETLLEEALRVGERAFKEPEPKTAAQRALEARAAKLGMADLPALKDGAVFGLGDEHPAWAKNYFGEGIEANVIYSRGPVALLERFSKVPGEEGKPYYMALKKHAEGVGGTSFDIRKYPGDMFTAAEKAELGAVVDRLEQRGPATLDVKAERVEPRKKLGHEEERGEPPLEEGYVRFYHGGEDPTSGGPRWVTPSRDYARHFRAPEGTENTVHYVDILKEDMKTKPKLAAGYDEINDLYRHFEAPEEYAKQLKELAAEPPIFERGKAAGVLQSYLDRENELVAKLREEQREAATKRAKELTEREQKPLWKKREAELLPVVREELATRPAFAVDRIMTEQGLKIHPDTLTEEQRARLPKSYMAKSTGLPADEVAKAVGFGSGDALAERLAMLTEERQRAGMSQREWFERAVKAEVQRRMAAEFDAPRAERMAELREEILSNTQMQLTHATIERVAAELGKEHPFSLDAMKAVTKQLFDGTALREIKTTRYLEQSGRIARQMAEEQQKAPLSLKQQAGKRSKAYQLLQDQQLMQLMAKEAAGYERARKAFDRSMQQAGKVLTKEVAAKIDPAYYAWRQHIMQRLGMDELKVSPGELQRNLNAVSDRIEGQTAQEATKYNPGGTPGMRADNFAQFVAIKAAEGRDLKVPDFLSDPAWPARDGKPRRLDDLTHGEFVALKGMMDALDKVGRNEMLVQLTGKAIRREQFVQHFLRAITEVGPMEAMKLDPEKLAQLKGTGWNHIIPEQILRRLARGDKQDPIMQLLAYLPADAINGKVNDINLLRKVFREKFLFKDMDKDVENTLFRDPRAMIKDANGNIKEGPGELLELKRRHVIGVLMHWGNEENIARLTTSWKVERAPVEDWLRRNTTREDWDRAQAIWDELGKLFGRADKMSRETTGTGIKRVDVRPFIDPFGVKRAGGYAPIGEERGAVSAGSAQRSMVQREGYFNLSTDQSYTKERKVGAMTVVDLSMDMVAKRMEQMVHDIHVRPAMIEMGKVLRDSRVQNAFTRQGRLGEHAWDQVESWFNDFINNRNYRSDAAADAASLWAKVRHGFVTTVIAAPSVAMKHAPTAMFGSMGQVGPMKFWKAFVDMYRTDPHTMSKNLATIEEESGEARWRSRNFTEALLGQGIKLRFEKAGPLERARELFTYAGGYLVDKGDYLTVRPVYWAARNDALAEGASLELARQIGDAAVRYAHGTSRLHGQAAIVRSEGLKAWTAFYSIFSHLLQKHYEMGWKARDILNEKMGRPYGEMPKDIAEGMGRWVPHMAWMLFCYDIMPALIEEMVSPSPAPKHGDEEGYGAELARGAFHFGTAMAPGVREWANALLYPGRQGGIMDVGSQMAQRLQKDIHKGPFKDAATAGRTVKDALNALAATTRIGNVLLSNSAEYSIRVGAGLEEPPQNPAALFLWDIPAGLRYGTAKDHHFTDWWKHVSGGGQTARRF